MLSRVSVNRIAAFADLTVSVSTPYQDGALAKRSGQPKQIPPLEFENDASQLEYELEWIDGWEKADVELEASLLAGTGIVKAVSHMSHDQLLREVQQMKRRWHIALGSWSPELAWQQAIVSRVTRTRHRNVLLSK